MVKPPKEDIYDRAQLRAVVNDARGLHTTTQEVVLEALRQAILRGLLPPGIRLRQEALAEVLDAGSRIPVREALRVLEFEGLVDSQPHRGFTVTGHDPHQIEEIYEMRAVLETHALRIAIPLLTDADVEELGQLSRAMVAEDDEDAALQLRERFYTQLYSITGRPRLVGLITRLRQEVAASLRQRSIEESTHHHQRLFEAIQAGDADAAAAELTSHYRKVAGLIRRALNERRMDKELELATRA